MKSLFIVITLTGFVTCHGLYHGSRNSSGEHFGENCTIVPAGTTNCTGITGHTCSDSTYLGVSSLFLATGLMIIANSRHFPYILKGFESQQQVI